jgi:predicted amidohydrolase YtcJ
VGLDLLLTNATVMTMDPLKPYAGAVGVEGDRIVWVGDAEDAHAHLVGVKETRDLGGATLIPGFNEAHHHLMMLGHWMSQLDCGYPSVTSIADILAVVGARAAQTPDGQWIEGRGHRAGWQVAIHAIGDRGIEMCLDGFERALQREPRADHRHRLEHCGILRPDLIRRIKELGVVPVGQPPFIWEFGDGFLRHLGRERCQLTYALKTVLDAGIPLTASSDSPVSSYQPLLGIKTAVVEKTATGADYAPGEAISVEDAIALYTRAGAYASFDEKRKGTITVGKLADFAILGADPRSVVPEEIDKIPVLGTMSGGRMVYEAPIAATVGS